VELYLRSLSIPSWCRQGQLQYFYITNFVRLNIRSIIEEVSGKNFNGSVSGLIRVISAEFILEDWVKS
jgi:hypothetical protein